jgi:chromosome segregation ATPase
METVTNVLTVAFWIVLVTAIMTVTSELYKLTKEVNKLRDNNWRLIEDIRMKDKLNQKENEVIILKKEIKEKTEELEKSSSYKELMYREENYFKLIKDNKTRREHFRKTIDELEDKLSYFQNVANDWQDKYEQIERDFIEYKEKYHD